MLAQADQNANNSDRAFGFLEIRILKSEMRVLRPLGLDNIKVCLTARIVKNHKLTESKNDGKKIFFDEILEFAKKNGNEGEKIDFKAYWYKDDVKHKNELVKDLISLANGSINSIGEIGLLVVGLDESKNEIRHIHITDSKGNSKPQGKVKDEITQRLKNYTSQPLNFDVDYHTADGKTVVFITIQAHSYLIYLEKDLETPSRTYSRGTLLYRENAIIETASHSISEEFQETISRLDLKDKKKKVLKIPSVKPEIKIEARDILSLIVSPRDIKFLSENKGIKLSQAPKIYYEYYTLARKGSTEGFLFLGKYTPNKHTFPHFFEKFENSLPESLEIFLVKKRQGNRVVDRKSDIYKYFNEYNLNGILGQNVHYLDDIVWDYTIDDEDIGESSQRSDFIDQKIYQLTDDTLNLLHKKSIDFFLEILDDYRYSSISVVYGSGGVGKTTFCNTLVHKISQIESIRKKAFYVKGERVVKYFLSEKTEISSLKDLYKLCQEDSLEFSQISEEHFRLNFIAGNIVVIIDAIEELESALNEKFDLEQFFKSLKILHERFQSTKIIVTTREHFLPKIKELESISNIDYYQLQGFEESDLLEFLNKRYRSEAVEIKKRRIKEVNGFIENNSLVQDQYIIPLFVDWVCEIVDRPDQSAPGRTEYLFKDNKLDKLLINLLQREIDKQSLNIDIDGMFLLLEEIVIEYSGKLSKKDFDEYIKLSTGQDSKNYIKNPLLKLSNNDIELKYDVLPNLIKSRFVHHALVRKQAMRKIALILKECYQGEGDIFLKLVETLSEENVNLKEIIKDCIKEFKNILFNEQQKEAERERIRKSISALLYILVEIEKAGDKEIRTQLIKDVYETKDLIIGLFIYGDFGALDFSQINVQDSRFDGYYSFFKCNFPDKDGIVFYTTKFSNIHIPKTKGIRKTYFDSTCEYFNCNLDDVFTLNVSKKTKKLENLRRDISSIIGYIDTSQRSLNKIKQNCKVTYPKGIEKLLDLLYKGGFLKTVEKSGSKMYKLKNELHDAIPSINLGIFPEDLESLIESIL
ncbi:RNA-binding domain-containing protein [Adonisia turfae]|uniref:ATP-binding protein n=1 Tax=Adonisia turfae CCMR0081 TaxID=2292702 RepID=A0A6M0RMS3_9CYAN|nr:NACHT domain-containing protein [Adonisia turfae]NEZ57063.1 ATP-binding protein [Adonisia turfae CCMR0081]